MVIDKDANFRRISVQKWSALKATVFLRSPLVFSFDLLNEYGTEEFDGKCDQYELMTHNSLQP